MYCDESINSLKMRVAADFQFSWISRKATGKSLDPNSMCNHTLMSYIIEVGMCTCYNIYMHIA